MTAIFNSDSYRTLVLQAKQQYTFRRPQDFPLQNQERAVLWRHDVDFSPVAALSLARIEHEENIAACYFVNIHNRYHNIANLENTRIFSEILDMGHEIALHFDAHYYGNIKPTELESVLESEKHFVDQLLGTDVAAFSFHDPDQEVKQYNNWTYSGLINMNALYFFEKVAFISDSSKSWKYGCLPELLVSSPPELLQVLTHPLWWCYEGKTPMDSIIRFLDEQRDVLVSYNSCNARYRNRASEK